MMYPGEIRDRQWVTDWPKAWIVLTGLNGGYLGEVARIYLIIKSSHGRTAFSDEHAHLLP